jgi:hypothetical protein
MQVFETKTIEDRCSRPKHAESWIRALPFPMSLRRDNKFERQIPFPWSMHHPLPVYTQAQQLEQWDTTRTKKLAIAQMVVPMTIQQYLKNTLVPLNPTLAFPTKTLAP